MPKRAALRAAAAAPRHNGKALLFPMAIVLAVLLAYSNSLHGPFIYDDTESIPNNPAIRSLRTSLSPPRNDTTVAGRPVLNLSFAVNYVLSGRNVWSYHAANIAIHAVSALLLFGLLRRSALRFHGAAPPPSRAQWFAGCVALLWALHPLQTSSVTYIVQRAESLMGMFYLAVLYCAVRQMEEPAQRHWTVLAVAACALGMGTKEAMATAPLLVLLIDRALYGGSFVRCLRARRGLYAALAATWAIIPLFALGARTQTAGLGLGALTPAVYLVTQCRVITHYLRLVVWPHPLVLDYEWPPAACNAADLAWLGLMLLLGGAAVWLWVRRPVPGLAAVAVFILLAPASSFVPINTEVAAEHRMYLPLAPLLVLLVSGLAWLEDRAGAQAGRMAVAALLIWAALLGAATWQRNTHYRGAVTIWERTVADRPTRRGYANLALAYIGAGRHGDARQVYERLLAENPQDPETHKGLGVTWLLDNDNVRAEQHLRRAVELAPGYAEARLNLGAALAGRGLVDEAITQMSEAVRLKPGYAMARYNLALLLRQKGRNAEAEAEEAQLRRIDPAFQPPNM